MESVQMPAMVNEALKYHKEICIAKEQAITKEQWDRYNAQAEAVREMMKRMATVLPDNERRDYKLLLTSKVQALQEAMYFEEFYKGMA